jgi:CelD/BcsL family acetyltransferase involved in cellulose biosynthesis
LARYSVGSLLTAWALQSLTAEGVEKVDLGEGGQEHNRRLGCEEHAEGTVHLYAPTLRGFRANLFFASAQFVRTTGRKAINTLRRKRPSRAQSQDPVRGGDLEVA